MKLKQLTREQNRNVIPVLSREHLETLGGYYSFTRLPKLGINPKNEFNSPVGIYGYPVAYQNFDLTIPFAKERPYVNFFNVVSVSDLRDLYLDDYQDDLLKWVSHVPKETLDWVNDVISQYDDHEQFWVMTRYISALSLLTLIEINALDHNSFYATGRHVTARWTKVLLSLGLDAILDHHGVIHPNEPAQIVVLNPKVIVGVDRYSNPLAEKYNVILDTKSLLRALRRYHISSSERHAIIQAIQNDEIMDLEVWNGFRDVDITIHQGNYDVERIMREL